MNGLVSAEALRQLRKAHADLQRALSRVEDEARVDTYELFRSDKQIDLGRLLAIIGQPEVSTAQGVHEAIKKAAPGIATAIKDYRE